jgi:hypothetical protein
LTPGSQAADGAGFQLFASRSKKQIPIISIIHFIPTYAGFEGESELLMDLYKKAVDRDEHPEGQAVRIHPTLPIYENREARIFCYWDHEAPGKRRSTTTHRERICGPQPLPVYIKINGCPASPLLFQQKPMIAVWKWGYSPIYAAQFLSG